MGIARRQCIRIDTEQRVYAGAECLCAQAEGRAALADKEIAQVKADLRGATLPSLILHASHTPYTRDESPCAAPSGHLTKAKMDGRMLHANH